MREVCIHVCSNTKRTKKKSWWLKIPIWSLWCIMCEFFFLHFMLITKAYRKTLCTTISATSGVLDIPFAHFSYNPGRYIIPYILKFHNFIHEKLYCFYAKSAHYSNEGNGFFIVILFLLLARRVVLYNLIKSHNTQHIISNFRKNFQTFLP
jgi:hypothetical protein